MRAETVRLFQTLPHACGYFADRTAQNLVIDPDAPQIGPLYEVALARGYRRAGGQVYRPNCVGCLACIACRVPVRAFLPDRAMRRCLKRNADLDIRVETAGFSDERFALYQAYLKARHLEGGMDDSPAGDFSRFLFTSWSRTSFIEFRAGDRLIAVAVTDVCRDALSAVYTFFDPGEMARSPGTFAILSQIELARTLSLDHVYLGFWINGHPKMDYKSRFNPLEVLVNGGWRAFDAELPSG
ncbi:MAG: arginyltransferase [Dokdonella sp.]